MACQAMHSWTFSGLVGAFLDLAIAYLLLCASTLAVFASKFLGLFGLHLPCPCDGLFANPGGNYCLHRLLVDHPIERVSSVQLSVRSKFPFGSIWPKDQNYHLNLKLIGDKENDVNGFVELEGDASCSSISASRKTENVSRGDLVTRNESGKGLVIHSLLHAKEGRFDLKGKGIMNQRPRSGFRRRRKCVIDSGKASSASSYDPSCVDACSHSNINRKGCEEIERNSVPVDSGVDANHLKYDEDCLMKSTRKRASQAFELDEPFDENNLTERILSSFEEAHTAKKDGDFDDNEKNAITILEEALEEERAARAALYLELEKERSAAATAADEAMAMILRLQEEKASIEMEARQYQRMIEEKSAYDAEEMDILKEILVRREREKHVLEMEVEAYRQLIYDENQQLPDVQCVMNTQRGELTSLPDLGEDLVLMLQQLSNSIDKKEVVKDKNPVTEVSSVEKQSSTLFVEENLQYSGWNEEAELSKLDNLDKQFSHISGSSQEHYISEETMTSSGKQQEQNNNLQEREGMAMKIIETRDITDIHIPCDGENLDEHGGDSCQERKDPSIMMLDMEPHVHDVHVIGGESYKGNQNKCISINDISNIHRSNELLKDSEIQKKDVAIDCPSTSAMDTASDINRSSSDITAGLPPLGGSLGDKSILPDHRRHSLSAVDIERLKIDSEVGWLRERLRVVQEGREKLNFSVDRRERENYQLQLLEDIACQLRDIWRLTEPGKAVRQASLPLPPSKDITKKRRRRGVSVGVHKSS
ncbi:uncharacterized protein LOC127800037 [Diospyros lotus]|uniref:uncharacterized protein LOC127800037 n=1 Tax=Diospyros lotus TaxID=55363 RepID=UPI0022514351|nr:uncharacterized protein LOC127800037 [Diospyros lotus]XP_052190388.1 uncharacterized protein LOC127800037 [Diospyros lotus]XP_052190389.1 uncharacterized protein LOC127800037 [Diospyros lotus]